MTITFSNFNKSLNKYFLCENKPHIVVGVSGGPDSIALTFILNKWIKKNKGTLTALIVDHKIREDSYFESLDTKKFLDFHKINNKILAVSRKKVLKGQMNQARNNRFNVITNYCKINKIFHVFLGHHFDDNIETFLLRKIAGSNFEGLNCMQHVSIYKNIQIIRPFLSFSKKEILSFNKKFNLKYINDPSNYSVKYSRSIVRKYLYDDKYIFNKVIKDFNLIRNNYFQYKKMVFQIFNLVAKEIRLNKIILDIKKLLRLEYELQVKLVDISFKFLNNNKFKVRYKKIEDIIKIIEKPLNVSFKMQNIFIKKNDDSNIVILSKIK